MRLQTSSSALHDHLHQMQTAGLLAAKISRSLDVRLEPSAERSHGLGAFNGKVATPGQRYSTWPYDRPEDLFEVIAKGLQSERGPAGELYDTDAVSDLAFELLREVRDRKVKRR
jgi:hypothetical protein